MNVLELWKRQVEARPEGRALIWTEGGVDRCLSFLELDRMVDSFAHGLAKAGVTQGDRVLLLERPGPRFVALAWALFGLGAVPILIDPGMGVSRLLDCASRSGAAVLLGVRRAQLLHVLHGRRLGGIRLSICTEGFWPGTQSLDALADRYAGARPLRDTPDGELAAILYTSGSTGPAKGVNYTHSTFVAQTAALQAMFNFAADEIDMPGFPLFALFSGALGLTCALPQMDASRPAQASPARLLRTITDWNVHNLQGSPAIWLRLGEYCLARGLRLPSVRRVITFGAPISTRFQEVWHKLLGEHGEVWTPYGATEALPVSLIGGVEVLAETAELTAAGQGVCVGRPVPSIEVRIVPVSNEPMSTLEAAEVGEIVVSGPQVTAAYDGDEAATRASKIIEDGKLWHRMGDLGRVDEQGRLWMLGRKSEQVQVDGVAWYPVAVEGIAERHPDVERAALVDAGGKPALVLQLRKAPWHKDVAERNRISREVRERLAEHPPFDSLKEVLFKPDFPVDLRHNIKIDRAALGRWAATQGTT